MLTLCVRRHAVADSVHAVHGLALPAGRHGPRAGGVPRRRPTAALIVGRPGRVEASALWASRSSAIATSGGGRRRRSPHPYNGAASSGSNLGPSHPALSTAVPSRVAALRAAHPEQRRIPIPVDLVTTSGSGLDPHISPAAAHYQVPRVARARGLSEARRCADWSTPTHRRAPAGSVRRAPRERPAAQPGADALPPGGA
jgi:K+-transporting ATPase ATPase C chain